MDIQASIHSRVLTYSHIYTQIAIMQAVRRAAISKGVCMATTKARKTMIGIDLDVDGWIEWAGKFRSGSQAEYLNQLARKDRDRAIADDETAKKYLAYLTATGRNAEMESLDRRNERKARREE